MFICLHVEEVGEIKAAALEETVVALHLQMMQPA